VVTVCLQYLSYYVRASSGATIVLLATLLFFAAIAAKYLRHATVRAS